jgi:prevent-host-death family protein
MYTVHQAKTQFSRLLEQAEEGKDVVIARGKKPVARLVPIHAPNGDRKPGALKGKISYASDAFAPLTKAELREWDIE